MRSGAEYLAGLNDGRSVYLDGEAVLDLGGHPAFHGPARTIARLYDRARDADPGQYDHSAAGTGERVSDMWLIPRTADDLRARTRTHRMWAEGSFGLMGRTPDHVAAMLCGFAGRSDVFGRGGTKFAENVESFVAKAARDDAYVAYAIVPPQIDRSKSAAGQPEPFLYPGVVAERDDGIVVRGAQMIGTAAVLADWILITYIVPLQPGDEDYALSFVVPVAAPGVHLYPRRPYPTVATSVYDYPLSSQFDETDSVVVLENVFVPWEQVFIYRDIGLCNAQFFETGAHLLGNYQALLRFSVKLQFMAGLAQRITRIHGIDGLPPVQSSLGGDLAAFVAAIEALAQAALANHEDRDGLIVPSAQFTYSAMSLQRRWIVDLMRAVRELAGGSFLAVPSSGASFMSTTTAADTQRYFRSTNTTAEDRVKFLKLAWDLVGTEFGGRQLQYEMFYSAAQHVIDARVYRSFDWATGQGLVDACLDGYALE